MRLTEHQVEQIIGQTPCVCGDVETWHPACYKGKTKEQIAAEYKTAYRIARVKAKAMLEAKAMKMIRGAAHE